MAEGSLWEISYGEHCFMAYDLELLSRFESCGWMPTSVEQMVFACVFGHYSVFLMTWLWALGKILILPQCPGHRKGCSSRMYVCCNLQPKSKAIIMTLFLDGGCVIQRMYSTVWLKIARISNVGLALMRH